MKSVSHNVFMGDKILRKIVHFWFMYPDYYF